MSGLVGFLIGLAIGGALGSVITNTINKKKIQIVSRPSGGSSEPTNEEDKNDKLEEQE